MEEDKGTTDIALEKDRRKSLMNVVTLAFFIITIFLLAYIVYLYYPLKEQILRDCYKNVTTYGNITGFNLSLNITP